MSTSRRAEVGDLVEAAAPGRARTQPGVERLFLSPGRTTRVLVGLALGFAVLNLIAQVGHLFLPKFLGRDWLFVMFNAAGEANLPSVFSGGLLLFCGLLLGAIGLGKRRAGQPFSLHWRILSGVFLYLALDEVAQIHDNLIPPLRQLLHTSGALYYAWVVPYGALVLVLLLGSLRFLAHLPRRTRQLFLLAGAVYVSGALGIELLQSYNNTGAWLFTPFMGAMSVAAEELMEMLGAVLFSSALLSYIAVNMPGFALQLAVAPGAGSPGER